MRWKDAHFVGKFKEFFVQGVVKHTRKLCCGHAGAEEVRASHISDEENISSEYAIRNSCGNGVIENHDADRLGCVPGSFEQPQRDITDAEFVSVMRGEKIEFCRSGGAEDH